VGHGHPAAAGSGTTGASPLGTYTIGTIGTYDFGTVGTNPVGTPGTLGTLGTSNVWDVFDAVVARFGDRTAVELQRRDGLDRYSYRDLHQMAVERSEWLAANGIGPGDRCAILADNDAKWCAAYLGILRLGAIAVPLDTNYSAKQVATIVNDSGAKILFANDRLTPTAREALVGSSCALEPLAPAFAHPDADELRRGRSVEPQAPLAPTPLAPLAPLVPLAPLPPLVPAVILYTSGTTADPKGVVLTHANLLAERDAAFSVLHVTERDAVLGVLPLFHSLAQLANLLLPFAVGARVVYLETITSTDLVRALSEREITIFACVPQFFYLIHQRVMTQVNGSGWLKRQIFKALLALSFRLRRVGVNVGPTVFGRVHTIMGRRMRFFVTGGSKFDPAIGRDLYALGFTILQAYGLTETSGAATISTADDAHIDTVGRPLPGIEAKILADEEIAIRGPIVMQGYFNRPDATAGGMQDGWFLTGDLGRMDAEGRITITGRKKEMIVLASGKNIYPEEIEANYRKSPLVKEICVLGLADDERATTERLHAVIVPDAEVMRQRKIVNAGEALRFDMEGLSADLPPHKRVLGYDIWFDPLPRTTTGKVKRHEVLRRLEAQRHDKTRAEEPSESAADPTWTDDQHAMSAADAIRRRVGTRARVVPDANLELDLGLDSMERVELLTELEQTFAVRVPSEQAHEIFTVQQLIDAVRPTQPREGVHVEATASLRSPEPGTSRSIGDDSWAILLRDLPAEHDASLNWLLRRRPVMGPLTFLIARLVRLLMGRANVSGLEHLPRQGPYLICPNHQSFIDPICLNAVLPYRTFVNQFFVGAVEYFKSPFTRWVARAINLVPVDPDSNLVPAMQAGAFGLRHGKILMLFPEGERSIDGTVKRFKKGATILARHLRVPIVPVALHGVYEIWPRNRRFNWSALLPWSGHRITIQFGEPMVFGEDEGYTEAALRLRDRVAAMWQAIDEESSKGTGVRAESTIGIGSRHG
jgi:long-chain acyl-CoA synthetase